jgi:hypothetical protein
MQERLDAMRRQTHCAAAQDRCGPGQSNGLKPQRFRCDWLVVLATLRAKGHVKERSVEYAQKERTCVHYAMLVLGAANLPPQLRQR